MDPNVDIIMDITKTLVKLFRCESAFFSMLNKGGKLPSSLWVCHFPAGFIATCDRKHDKKAI